jgi:hypothetical protein
MMSCKIFYSWQSDLPNSTNRGFIGQALENAVKAIRKDDSIQVEPVVDRDTAGVPGTPDIASTILSKIEQAQAFVCDVSIINQSTQSRFTPNPNVLIELGYAMKALGTERIVMVMNSAFGAPESLPFDLRMRRAITYHMPMESEERAPERKKLEATLTEALRAILAGLEAQTVGEVVQPPPIGDQAKVSVENSQPNQSSVISRFMAWLTEEIAALASNKSFDEAIGQTKGIVLEFARLAEVIATMNAFEAAHAMYKGFGSILECYNLPRGFVGTYQDTDFDFYKFMGHELFVTFFSFLIREKRWKLSTELLEEDIYIENPNGTSKPELVPFTYVSKQIQLLKFRNKNQNLGRVSLHADFLNKRHTEEVIAELVPMQQFMDADYFLFLRAEIASEGFGGWVPWSTLYLEQPPKYLIEASRAKYAQELLQPLGAITIATLREQVDRSISTLQQVFGYNLGFSPLGNFEPQTIGSR